MEKKVTWRVSGIILFIIGVFFLINSRANITGAVVGVSVSLGFNSIFGVIFVIIFILLLVSGRYITQTIDDLVKSGVSKDKIDSIQKGIKDHYNGMSKEQRKSVYQETADVMKEVQDGKRVGGTYNLHTLRIIPPWLRGTVPADKKLLEGDAKVLCRYQHQGGRGTERYVFDSDTRELLGIAYHRRGNSRDLNWRVRF